MCASVQNVHVSARMWVLDVCLQITFNLTDSELGFYDNDGMYHVEDGKFDIMIGGSCQKVLKTTAERTTVLKSK